jgi:hypothetical protein
LLDLLRSVFEVDDADVRHLGRVLIHCVIISPIWTAMSLDELTTTDTVRGFRHGYNACPLFDACALRTAGRRGAVASVSAGSPAKASGPPARPPEHERRLRARGAGRLVGEQVVEQRGDLSRIMMLQPIDVEFGHVFRAVVDRLDDLGQMPDVSLRVRHDDELPAALAMMLA